MATQEESARLAAEAQRRTSVARQGGHAARSFLIELGDADGPAVVTAAALEQLALTESERIGTEAALQAARQAYLALEAQHTQIVQSPDGFVRVTVEPFAVERAKLVAELERDLVAVLGPQRGEALLAADSRAGPAGVAPYGEWPCELEILPRDIGYTVQEVSRTPGGDERLHHIFPGRLPVRFRRFLP